MKIERKEDIKRCFEVGDIIKGFCNGYFGRDDYEEKKCISVGVGFAVFEYDNGYKTFLQFPKDKNLFWSQVECWRKEE